MLNGLRTRIIFFILNKNVIFENFKYQDSCGNKDDDIEKQATYVAYTGGGLDNRWFQGVYRLALVSIECFLFFFNSSIFVLFNNPFIFRKTTA